MKCNGKIYKIHIVLAIYLYLYIPVPTLTSNLGSLIVDVINKYSNV